LKTTAKKLGDQYIVGVQKLDRKMFQMNDSWKPVYFEVKKSKVKVTSHNKFVSVFRQNAALPLAAYVSHAGFSLLVPAAPAMLATSGFP